jgi:hypothetical protein
MDIPAPLRTHAARRSLVVMAGAGVSAGKPTSLPDWYRLNAQIVAAVRVRLDAYWERPGWLEPVQAAIAERRSHDQFPPDYQAELLNENCGDDYFRALRAVDVPVTNATHEAIAWLCRHGFVAAVVTTNFDRLIELALDRCGVAYDAAFEPQGYRRCAARLADPVGERPVQVIKIHGSVADHTSLIDTLKQRRRGRNADLQAAISLLLERHVWVFAGFSAADLEDDETYLQFIPKAATCPGLVYLQWPGSRLRPGAEKLLAAYAGKCWRVEMAAGDYLATLAPALGAPPPPAAPAPPSDTALLVEDALKRWAAALHPAAVANCLAALAEANGDTQAAFKVLHRFWKDVLPRDREGPCFEQFRYQHGRLGMGYGQMSLAQDLDSDAGMESLQNLFRRSDRGSGCAAAWAGLAFMWAGDLAHAAGAFDTAVKATESLLAPAHAEERLDIWLALAEWLYVLGEPEHVFATLPARLDMAVAAGDLPRQARALAIGLVYQAEFTRDGYEPFAAANKDTLKSAARLNDPWIEGLQLFARGRYHCKRQEPALAVPALRQAIVHLSRAGRPPWAFLGWVEVTKSHIDEQKIDDAVTILNELTPLSERLPLLAIWRLETAGQLYRAVRNDGDARGAFAAAESQARQIGLTRRADLLRMYLGSGQRAT